MGASNRPLCSECGVAIDEHPETDACALKQLARDELRRFREIDYCPSCASLLYEAGLRVEVNGMEVR